MYNFDDIDKQILASLIKDARVPVQQISKKVGITGVAVQQRIKKMINADVFKGSRFIINHDSFGFKTLAFVGIFLDKSSHNDDVIAKLGDIPNVTECHYTTGNYSLFIKIISEDNEHLMRILNKQIQTIEGVVRTETIISFDQQIDRELVPLS